MQKFGKNFVRATLLQMKLQNSGFDEIFFHTVSKFIHTPQLPFGEWKLRNDEKNLHGNWQYSEFLAFPCTNVRKLHGL